MSASFQKMKPIFPGYCQSLDTCFQHTTRLAMFLSGLFKRLIFFAWSYHCRRKITAFVMLLLVQKSNQTTLRMVVDALSHDFPGFYASMRSAILARYWLPGCRSCGAACRGLPLFWGACAVVCLRAVCEVVIFLGGRSRVWLEGREMCEISAKHHLNKTYQFWQTF